MYKVTAYSFWVLPQEYFVETKDEADELEIDLRNAQYSVDVELMEDSNEM